MTWLNLYSNKRYAGTHYGKGCSLISGQVIFVLKDLISSDKRQNIANKKFVLAFNVFGTTKPWKVANKSIQMQQYYLCAYKIYINKPIKMQGAGLLSVKEYASLVSTLSVSVLSN